mmetsp:Transcript_52360/g.125032  ORF Transcript_52360/g.125032 Transcript_52360/m.125032 type:complete len:375 (-) Transcript_52360:174-1298(-)|eukprot:CAMPEP_0178387492 /NCGR_PEP_ID=MMETSP0689_2-20121128/9102_1 /TAXON_ID=160604 /ORGANISM="Amphidinium massartii, Strain CS-259" /LENGTH=374 /DNA_ID=CAMNT_0020007859 /DNA_START=43 /DNA_END=1167 /DNA_ORIENTATION=-
MGLAASSSGFEREACSECAWNLSADGVTSEWSEFLVRHYSVEHEMASGLAMTIVLPQLLRSRLQDWMVTGVSVYLGQSSISFGRQLSSRSETDVKLFYGVDILFGDHSAVSWIWYCRSTEWCLQLHKAMVEALPPPPIEVSASSQPMTQERFPGRPHWLVDAHDNVDQEGEFQKRVEDKPMEGSFAIQEAAGDEENGPQADRGVPIESAMPSLQEEEPECAVASQDVTGAAQDRMPYQLTLILSNAEAHPGILSLPIPLGKEDEVRAVVQKWNENCEGPLTWAGRRFQTETDFQVMREVAVNLTDLLLLGLEPDLSSSLNPDWTWERYPRGVGEVACRDDPEQPDFNDACSEEVSEWEELPDYLLEEMAEADAD